MAGDFNKPTAADLYAALLQVIRDNQADLLTLLEFGDPANLPTGAKRINPTSKTVERWNGTAWVEFYRAASATEQGAIELATQAEVDAGTDAVRAVTPATLHAKTIPNADKVDGFHASQTPGNSQIPVTGADGRLSISNGAGLAQLRPNGDMVAARGTTDGVVFLDTAGNRFLQCLNGVYLFGNGAATFQARHDGNTFHGRVASDGTAIRLPPGWSSVKNGTGVYTITHNLGHGNYTVTVTAEDGISVLDTKGVNSFVLATYTLGGLLADLNGFFTIHLD